MKNRILSLALVICLLCSLVPVTASAAEIVDSGTITGSNISWTLDSNGLLTLSGSGEIPRCSMESDIPWFKYYEDITAAVVEDGITNIGYYCFYKCYQMESVSIPDSVTAIEPYAFYWCRSLTELVLPQNVKSIGMQAFYNCDGLESIELSNRLIYVGYSAFDSCRTLTEITIPASVETLESYCFRSCENLRTVAFEGNAPAFGGSVFSGNGLLINMICRYPENNATWTSDVMQDYGGRVTWEPYTYTGGDTEIEIPVVASGTCGENASWTLNDEGLLTISGTGPMGDYDYTNIPWKDYRKQITAFVVEEGITSLCTYCFAMCSNLTEITLSSTVESMGHKAIYSNASLTAIHVAEDNPYYSSLDGMLFNKDQTQLLEVPITVTEVTIPEGITSISDSTFSNCKYLSSVTLPDSLTSIGEYAFAFCYSLKEITIPEGVITIGKGAFYDSNLANIWFRGDQPVIGENAFGTLEVNVYFPAKYESWWYYQDVYGAKVIAYIPYELGLPGDLNADDIVDDADVALLLWHTLFPENYAISGDADFTGDDNVDDADVAYLLWHTLFPENYPL